MNENAATHKFAERRILVAETCGFIAPYIPVALQSSLIFSMLSQMLQEDRSEDVRKAVIKSLSLNLSYVTDERKYHQSFDLFMMGLNDGEESVVMETKNYLLPILSIWASELSLLQSNMLNQLLTKCLKALQSWYESNIANSTLGESTSIILTSASDFNNYISCLIRIVTIMFMDCLLKAPFAIGYK